MKKSASLTSLYFATALAACGGTRTQSTTTPASEAPPVLTQAQIAADSTQPGLLIGQQSPWVAVPSFRVGVKFPDGWFRPNAEEFAASLEASNPNMDMQALRSSLQAGAMQEDPNRSMLPIIPNVRVLLMDLQIGGTIPGAEMFCGGLGQGMTESGAVNPQTVEARATNMLGFNAIECAFTSQQQMSSGLQPLDTRVTILLQGDYALIMSTNGGPTQNVSAIHQGMTATLRTLEVQ